MHDRQHAGQTTLYVDSSVTASGAGTSWATAYKTLNEALNVANAANLTSKYIIQVARGTYYPTGAQSATDRDSAFLILRGGISLYGGYPTGGGTRNTITNPTVLSGNIGAAGSAADNSYHIMVAANISAASDSLMIDGLSFTGGNANGGGSRPGNAVSVFRYSGSALYSVSVSCPFVVRGCAFYGNSQSATNATGGGAFYLGGSQVRLSDCSFTGNTVSGSLSGGALFATQSNIALAGGNFTGNTASGNGGAVYLSNTSSMFSNAVFANNSAGAGGAIYTESNLSSSSLTFQIQSSAFNINTEGIGGAIYKTTHSGTVTGSSFSGNTATGVTGNGGAIYDDMSSSATRSSNYVSDTFTANTARNGGAVYIYESRIGQFLKCAFTGNTASLNGGALFNYGSNIDSSVFTGNKAGSMGGGLYMDDSYNSVTNTSFIADSAAIGGGIHSLGNTVFKSCRILSNKAVNGGGMSLGYAPTGGTAASILASVFAGSSAAGDCTTRTSMQR